MTTPCQDPARPRIYEKFEDDPEMLTQAEELCHSIQEVIAMRKNSYPVPADFGDDNLAVELPYAPVVRDCTVERTHCEATIPGYAEERLKAANGA